MTAPAWAAVLGALYVLEAARPLRPRRWPKSERAGRNLAVAALSALAIRLVETPIVTPLARRVARRREGLIPRLGLPPALERALGVLALDYTLYWWHRLVHAQPLLWRFHRVHHADEDLDASTALRFHFGETLLSVPFRALQVRLLGIGPRTLRLWQRLTFGSVLFHHSNLRLGLRAERALSRVVVTPRLHGIHHSSVYEERESNWSSGLTWWDRLHGTHRAGVAQRDISIGVPGFAYPALRTLAGLLRLPFGPQPKEPRLARLTGPEGAGRDLAV